MSESEAFDVIKRNTLERYSERYRRLGYDIRTLGWGSGAQQEYRFSQTLRLADMRTKTIMDIGCGFGDYYDFLKRNVPDFGFYTGADINPDLISEGKKRHDGEKKAEFVVVDVLSAELREPRPEVGIMLGVLNANLGQWVDNMQYTKTVLARAFALVRETLIVDFLSSSLDPSYPPETTVYYHDPTLLLLYALELTPNVALLHDYAPLPQKEVMLALNKCDHETI